MEKKKFIERFNSFFETDVMTILELEKQFAWIERLLKLSKVLIFSNIIVFLIGRQIDATLSATGLYLSVSLYLSVGQTAYWHRTGVPKKQVIQLNASGMTQDFRDTYTVEGFMTIILEYIWAILLYAGMNTHFWRLPLFVQIKVAGLILLFYFSLKLIEYFSIALLTGASLFLSGRVVRTIDKGLVSMKQMMQLRFQVSFWKKLKQSKMIGGLRHFIGNRR